MKNIIPISIFVAVVLIYVCLVWFLKESNEVVPEATTAALVPAAEVATSSQYRIETVAEPSISFPVESTDENINEVKEPATEAESITIPAAALTPTQLQLLDTFGIDSNNLVITPAMITCAKDELGAERYAEIIAGDTPTFLEGLSLAPCVTE